MRTRIQKINIRNFKAFRDFSFDLEGRHLLVYGTNGSGKSSLYWALYTFLQSASKPHEDVFKYFTPTHAERLLNIHEQASATPKPGEITLTLRDTNSKSDRSFQLTATNHGTFKEPLIVKGDLASDFITYRFFFGFSNFRNSDRYNLWPLFEKEILPFCVSTSGQEPLAAWDKIRSGIANPNRARGAGGTRAYNRFKSDTDTFAAILPSILNSINTEAQRFYDTHFAADDPARVEMKLGVTIPPKFDILKRQFTQPEIGFSIKVGDEVVTRPQVFLNEAKFTQLALSIRFAASLVNLRESDLKLLVLDDLLVSLDMDNRMRVVEILLSEPFADYQKIILTHDLGFFQEFKRFIGEKHSDWKFTRLVSTDLEGPKISDDKSELERAQDYLAEGKVPECGNQLRKYVEENLANFLQKARQKKGLDTIIDRGPFSSLHDKINEAINILTLSSYTEFAKLLEGEFTTDDLKDIIGTDEINKEKIRSSATGKKKAGKHIAKLYVARSQLQQSIFDLLSEASRKRLNASKILNEVMGIKNRILNPASHAGNEPLYSKEAKDAIKLIKQLNQKLTSALDTL